MVQCERIPLGANRQTDICDSLMLNFAAENPLDVPKKGRLQRAASVRDQGRRQMGKSSFPFAEFSNKNEAAFDHRL
jgi:hypothetical protein